VAAEAAQATEAVPSRGGLDRRGLSRLLGALAVTQTVGYGVLYYSFSVFLRPMAADLHASLTAITAALTVAVVVAGLCAIPVGRWIDRHGARALMSLGSVIGSLAVIAWSQAHGVVELYAVFLVIGVASAMVLYEPAFAAIVRAVDSARRASALLVVTIVAGFASSIFIPLAGALDVHLGWRHAVLTLAVVHFICTVPLHLAAVPRQRGPTMPPRVGARADRGIVHATLRSLAFWVLTVAFTAQGAAVAVVAVQLVGYLVFLGHAPAVAATIAGLLGVMSVTGRLATTGMRRRYTTGAVTVAVFLIQAAAVASLPALGRSAAGAIACVTLFGLGFGVVTIVRPALLADRYGASSYATISGTMAMPMNIAKAIAPLIAAVLISASASGYTDLMIILGAVCAAAGLLLLAQHRHESASE
jgi:MFS family permease